MKERPILFSAPMVRAILAGTKTQTRRVVKPQPPITTTGVSTWHHPDDDTKGAHFWSWGPDPKEPGRDYIQPDWALPCPYGQPGDRLWVREAWRTTSDGGRCNDMPPRDLQPHEVWYEADGFPPSEECAGRLRPSMFMPRWASRITLEVTGVRVERLQDISEADAIAEGIERVTVKSGATVYPLGNRYSHDAAEAYSNLWEQINGPGSWEANPWVWVVEFKHLKGGEA